MIIVIELKLVHLYFLLYPTDPVSSAARGLAARSLFIMHVRRSGRMGDQGVKLEDATNSV